MKKYNALFSRTSKRYRIYHHLPRKKNDIYPIALEVFPTNRCNSSCSFCAYSEFRNKEEIPSESFERLIEDISKSTIRSVSFAGGGEPLIYKNLYSAINKLSNSGIDVGIITNGLKLDQNMIEAINKCSWIRFSLLSATPEDFHALTGTPENNHCIICDNIQKITSLKNEKLYVSASYMSNVPGDSYEKVRAFIALASELHLDQIFFKKLVSDFVKTEETLDFYKKNKDDIVELAQDKKIITNIEKLISNESSKYKRRLNNEPCEILRLNLIGLINANGDYFPCLSQYVNSGLKYGNIKDDSLTTILERRTEIVKRIECNSCDFCRHWSLRSELAKYNATGRILNCNDPHYNFI